MEFFQIRQMNPALFRADQIAAQLYTCRDLVQDGAGLAKTCGRLHAAGYRAVQVSGIGPIADDEVKRILEGEGMVCCATHEPPAVVLASPEKAADRLDALDCAITAYPVPRGVDLSNVEVVDTLAAQLNHSAKVLRQRGKILCYHNHAIEFQRHGAQTVLERIYEQAPELQGEPDTYWIQYGGGDPVEWCLRLKGRLPIIHLKDYQVTREGLPEAVEVGAGNLDFPKIIAAAVEAECPWFAVEQDECPGDPVESLAQSFRFLEENFCS